MRRSAADRRTSGCSPTTRGLARFYRRNGFEPDGSEKFDDEWQVTEVRLVR